MKMNFHPLYERDLMSAAAGLTDGLCGKKVLITGATGLIGSFMVDVLLWLNETAGAGIAVYAAGRSEDGMRVRFGNAMDKPYFTFVPYDACKPVQFDFRADYVFHAACSAHPLAYAKDPVGIMQANLFGTMQLLEYLRGCPDAGFVFLSTGETYGENPDLPDGFSETSHGYVDPMNPRSCYPESKRGAETLCASYAAQYGVNARVARLCHVYGPTITRDNSRADAQFLRKALSGEDIVMKSTGSQVRSFCYVADAARALFRIMLDGGKGQAYNVANRYSVASIRDYAEILASTAGVSLTFDLPPEAEKAGYSKVTRAVLNPAKLENLGWSAEYSLEKGLYHTYTISAE
ncbi:MAG: NAD-dependent epimerase/dehydratase family protein [Clostridia bacterium]|nr:NAD-dependent epimerase/dehydratase family protein [Clostridia bacterium]